MHYRGDRGILPAFEQCFLRLVSLAIPVPRPSFEWASVG